MALDGGNARSIMVTISPVGRPGRLVRTQLGVIVLGVVDLREKDWTTWSSPPPLPRPRGPREAAQLRLIHPTWQLRRTLWAISGENARGRQWGLDVRPEALASLSSGFISHSRPHPSPTEFENYRKNNHRRRESRRERVELWAAGGGSGGALGSSKLFHPSL
ncbi:hypothetical protein NHX12_034355 [Muraenolepis orangiensis]|uniref:Uncharacterized protein n=1 Tax=Muraenolepis orangiensis TaxID=630683 RepID=A0A9Q0I057_9TELE|nr:hypothetical protein NHX12_034355 [Muraenolepis orangiensis]